MRVIVKSYKSGRQASLVKRSLPMGVQKTNAIPCKRDRVGRGRCLCRLCISDYRVKPGKLPGEVM